MKSILIIGMGCFGHHLAKNFLENGHDVMIIDENEEAIEDMVPYATSSKIGDCTREEVLKTIGVRNFDAVFVCIGTNFQSSLEITSAVNMERTIPRASVIANPLTLPLPIAPRTAAAIRVVMLPSTMADIAFWKPILMALLTLLPAAISSRIRA